MTHPDADRLTRARRALLTTSLALAAAAGGGLAAQGRTPGPVPPRPHPGSQVRATVAKVHVAVRDRATTVELVQTLHNDGRRPAEATWTLPLPPDASVDRFQMVVGDQVLDGEVLAADKAREVYQRIVRQRRDPGLLEYIDQGLLRARVFPIPPGGDVEVRVRYRQVLERQGSLTRFRFPLRALGVDGRPAERVGLQFDLESQTAIKNLYSPLDGLDVVRIDDHHAKASLELAGQMPNRDLDLFFGVDDKAFGLDLLAHRDGERGHFLMMLSPRMDWPEREGTRRVVQFVLDTSGSMRGAKIEQAKNALRSFVDSMKPEDRFDIVTFSTVAESMFGGPVPADAEHLEKARANIGRIAARGGTNIEEALQVSLDHAMPTDLADDDRTLPIVIFLTDGLPTVGDTNIDRLLEQSAQRNRHAARIFSFGVGFDVNTRLLDDLASANRGDTGYVRPDEDIEVETSLLFDKVSHPVLTDLEIVVDGVKVRSQEPKQLPDLFRGSSLNVLAEYEGSGAYAIRVRGKVQGESKELVYEATFPAKATEHDFVPVLWAKRRVAHLLEAIRSNGRDQELVDEVKRLSREYGLVTPFTSALIVEDELQLARQLGIETRRRQDRGRSESDEFFVGSGKNTGEGAVATSERLRRLKEAKDRGSSGPRPKQYRGPGDASPAKPAGGGGPRTPGAAGPSSPGSGPSSPGPAGPATGGRTGAEAPEASNRSRGSETAGPVTKRVGKRTFVWVPASEGPGVWVDRAFDREKKLPREQVVAFTNEYFLLLKKHPELKNVFALGSRVVVVVGDRVLELVEKASDQKESETGEEQPPKKESGKPKAGTTGTGSSTTGR